MSDLGLGFPLLSDPDRQVITAYGLADANEPISIPAVYVIGRDGLVAFRVVGETTADLPTLEAVLREAEVVSAAEPAGS